ncbi:MAG: metallophosphoesterase [Christensenellales bacterium]
MSKILQKNLPLVIALVLLISLFLVIGISTSSTTALASSDSLTGVKETFTMAQLSDIHYFSLDYCYAYYHDEAGQIKYIDKTDESWLSSDFNTDTYGDTKLVTESGMVLSAVIQNLLNSAQSAATSGDADAIDAIPDVLISTGDLSKNSERIALIDVANALRYLQNEMRKIEDSHGNKLWENFQVFAIPGNHDLYNGNASIYDNSLQTGSADGHSIPTDTLDTKTFAQIFESLGYPTYDPATQQVANTKVAAYAGGKNDLEYWYSVYTGEYVTSSLATNIKITYYSEAIQNIADKLANGEDVTDDDYLAIDASNNVLSYAINFFTDSAKTTSTGYTLFMMDSSEREETDSVIPVAISNAEINKITINDFKTGATPKYYYLDGTSYVAIESLSELLTLLRNDEIIFYNTGYDHITGGRITVEALDWVESLTKAENATLNNFGNASLSNYEETFIIAAHHNFLPHFDMEDEIVKDFTLYNWEYIAKRLCQMGIRYAYSGHMHTSDMQSYVDVNGNVLYDYQTGSTISYASPMRIMQFDRNYSNNEYLVEDVTSTLKVLEELREAPSQKITSAAPWDDSAVITESMTDQEKFEARFALNPDYFTYCYFYDKLSSYSYNEYISEDIYNRLIDRMLENFVSFKMIDSLKETLKEFLVNDFAEMAKSNSLLSGFADYGPILYDVADSLIDQIMYKLDFKAITNYLTGEKFTAENAIEFVDQIVQPFLNKEFGKEGSKMNIKEIAANIITRHNSGTELQGIDHLYNPELNLLEKDKTYAYALKDMCEQANSGKLVDDLLNTLLSPLLTQEQSLIKQLYTFKFDFSSVVEKYGTDQKKIDQLNNLFGMISSLIQSEEITVSNFRLEDVLVSSIVSGLINSLLENNFGVTIGNGSLIDFAEDFINKYMTDALYTNLGGYVEQIIVAFATDETADIVPITQDVIDTDGTDGTISVEKLCSIPVPLRYTNGSNVSVENYAMIGETQYTYVQGQIVPYSANVADYENGRTPNHFIAAFDNEAPQTSFDISFYTAEEVYAYIQLFDNDGNLIAELSTLPDVATYAKDSTTYNMESGKYLDSFKNSITTAEDIKIDMKSLAVPSYVPLIDLGVLCLTHAEVDYEVDKTEYTYGSTDRDAALTNSVMFYNHNTITISGLSANTTYKYRVYGITKGLYNVEAEEFYGDNAIQYYSLTDYVYLIKADNTKANYSVAPTTTIGTNEKVFSFKTALATDSNEAFDFLAVADPQGTLQSNYDVTKAVFDKIATDSRFNGYSFIANAGDMTDNGKNYLQWSLALDTMVEYYANTTVFMAAGNHESGSNSFVNFLTQTAPDAQNIEDGMYYSFTYGNSHFVVLNTNDSDGKDGLGATQLEWLINDLENNDSTWTFVVLHKSLYSVGSHTNDPEVVKMREQLTEIFAKYGVDVVIQGHDHTYSSTNFIDADGEGTFGATNKDGFVVNADGVVYMTIGTIGNKYYEYLGNEEFANLINDDRTIAETLSYQTFAYFTVDGDKLTIKDVKYNNGELTVFGELKITKELGDIASATSAIKINGTPLKLNSTIKVDKKNLEASIDMSEVSLQEGQSIKFYDANGNLVTNLVANKKAPVTYTVKLITDDETITLGTITLEVENPGLSAGAIAGITVACVVVAAGIAVAVSLVVIKKKKGAVTNENSDNNDSDNNVDEK